MVVGRVKRRNGIYAVVFPNLKALGDYVAEHEDIEWFKVTVRKG